MDFILDHKWAFLITAEVIFWLSILAFLILRYWFKLDKWSFLFLGIFLLNDIWIATMGYMDYRRTGEFSSYQIIILIVIIYAFTYGKSDFKKLDHFIKRKVAQWKGESVSIDKPAKLSGREHAALERKQFFLHLLVFVLAHIVLALFLGLSEEARSIDSITELGNQWFAANDAVFPFTHSTANNISRIWAIILVIDGIISLSYTLFPRKAS
ncbi:hypothetical protein H9655_08195 [Cytobacillus sp. Sa5YUA1]|uniref:Integral membrane protein n=1 Tax=Cytobacillus stercorigallinarum TaxID=2762240 RepID=A0ABR8QN97_9BACI|nr:hypothetical protein [Cytobacillus stercorigallinarum]MBD7937009.1 hypothetical protein [Cytobacillus stercorigallinarum]